MILAWPDIGFWDVWKAIAVALTGTFGIMGLLTNYKDKETGRITVWGRINMAGILLSATMGVLSQLIEAQNKAASAQRSALQAQRSASLAAQTATQAQAAATQARAAATNTGRLIADLLAVSRRTAAIAHGTERSVANSRAAAEAGKTAASRTLAVARSTGEAVDASKASLVRIERLLSPFDAPSLILLVQPKLPTIGVDPCPASARKASAWFWIDAVDRTGEKRLASYEGTQGVTYTSAPGIHICEIRIPLKATENFGIFSYLDLASRRIGFNMADVDANRYSITSFKITSQDGQEVRIPLDRAVLTARDVEQSVERSWSLSYTFPAGRDPRFAGP